MKKKSNWPPYANNTEDKLHNLFEALSDFEDFRLKVLPAIQKDLTAGLSAEELRKKYHALIQARQITSALMEVDHAKAAQITQNLIDRTEGKAVERQETTHKFEELPDKELDAVLNSLVKKAKSTDDLAKH
jgi:hypothetical protein